MRLVDQLSGNAGDLDKRIDLSRVDAGHGRNGLSVTRRFEGNGDRIPRARPHLAFRVVREPTVLRAAAVSDEER